MRLWTLKRPDGTLSIGDICHDRTFVANKYRAPSWAGYSIVECAVVEVGGDDTSHCLCRADIYQFEQQVTALKADLTEARNAILREGIEVNRLTAELAKYTEPLTYEQAEKVCNGHHSVIFTEGDVDDIDSAIRAVRGGGAS